VNEAFYIVMPQADRVLHSCWDDPEWKGVLTDSCAGCVQASAHPCEWCGYGNAFPTHTAEFHFDGGDPNVTDINAYGPEWTDFPHLYGDAAQ